MLRKLVVAFAALGALGPALTPAAFAAIPTEAPSAASVLGQNILNAMAAAPAGDKDAVLAAITNATSGAELGTIVEALRLLRASDVAAIVGTESGAQTSALATLARPEVQEALAESLEVATLALQSYGATGGVAAGGSPGQAFGSGSVGAPGGGGGSGYTN